MRFTVVSVLAALAGLVSANTIEFINQDSTPRTIVFTAQEGLEQIKNVQLDGLATVPVDFPTGWIGNFYAINTGAENKPGMLGELRWDGAYNLHFFDVSAIVNPQDTNGVKTLKPKVSGEPFSGCESYEGGCEHAYYASDDVQTKSTNESVLVCTVGTKQIDSKKIRSHARHFITGHTHL